MKETPSFIIHYHNTKRAHYDITIKKSGHSRTWILPSGIPVEVSERRIAVEENAGEASEQDSAYEDFYGAGERGAWDSGTLSISTENKIKYIFSAEGKKLKGKYLLHNPLWGRWTKRKLWVLEKLPFK